MADAIKNTPNTPTLSHNSLYLILGLAAIFALAAVIVIAATKRTSPFKVFLKSGEQTIEFDFHENVNLSDMLETLLSQKAEKSPDLSTQIHLVKAVLESHKFYSIPSKGAANEIRSMHDTDQTEETRQFVEAIRNTLYDLEGPFSQPNTLLGIKDNRLLNAFTDLNEKDPLSPLMQTIWEWKLEGRSFLRYRSIKHVSVEMDPSLAEGIAETCLGSILVGKTAMITSPETGPVGPSLPTVSIDNKMPIPCPETAAISAQDLLKGKGTVIRVSPKDMQQLRGEAMDAPSLVATLIPLPTECPPQ